MCCIIFLKTWVSNAWFETKCIGPLSYKYGWLFPNLGDCDLVSDYNIMMTVVSTWNKFIQVLDSQTKAASWCLSQLITWVGVRVLSHLQQTCVIWRGWLLPTTQAWNDASLLTSFTAGWQTLHASMNRNIVQLLVRSKLCIIFRSQHLLLVGLLKPAR